MFAQQDIGTLENADVKHIYHLFDQFLDFSVKGPGLIFVLNVLCFSSQKHIQFIGKRDMYNYFLKI